MNESGPGPGPTPSHRWRMKRPKEKIGWLSLLYQNVHK